MSLVPISDGDGSDTAPATATPIEPTTENPFGFSSTPSEYPTFSPTYNESSVSSIPSDYPSLAPTGISEAVTSIPVVQSDMPTVDEIFNSTAIPSNSASLAPSNIPISTRPIPADESAQAAFVFGCNGELAVESNGDRIPISLTVAYKAESSSSSTAIFVSSLERYLLETAVLAALDGCQGRVRRQLQNERILRDDNHRHLLLETMLIGN